MQIIKINIIMLVFCSILNAKNLFVAPNGNDTYTYEENSMEKPWATFAHGVYRVKKGDILNVRTGTYLQSYPIIIRWDYGRETYGGDPNEKVLCESGTATEPIIIKNYNNEEAIIDCKNVSILVDHDGRSYWNWQGLKFINANVVFQVGSDTYSYNNSFKNLNITRNRGGDNSAGITLVNGNAEYTTIQNCTLLGPGNGQGIHLNTCGIYLKAVENVKLLNNYICDVPIGIYFKHNNVGSTSTKIEIAYNFIKNTQRSSMELNCRYAKIHDNIIGLNCSHISNNNADGGPGGDFNTFEHNTFFSGGLTLNATSATATDTLPGSLNCVIKNNIFLKTVSIHISSTLQHNTVMAYNAYQTGVKIIEFDNRNSYSPAQWDLHYKQSVNSIEGEIKFLAGNGMGNIEDYILQKSTTGARGASDGKDIGADVIAILNKVPVINSKDTATGTKGKSFTYTITASYRPDTFYVQNLPAGLTLNKLSGTIEGIPSDSGTFRATLTARNIIGLSNSLILTIKIAFSPVPVIDCIPNLSAYVGKELRDTIHASKNPTSFSGQNLPSWLKLDTTGVLHGVPLDSGSVSVIIRAQNSDGLSNPCTTKIRVTYLPVIKVDSVVIARVGKLFSYTAKALYNPIRFYATNLPVWLTIDSLTGIMAGTPIDTGTSRIVLWARNESGLSNQYTLTLKTLYPEVPIISGDTIMFSQVNKSFTYKINASKSPTAYSAVNLPDWVTFDSVNGVLSGIPVDTGMVKVVITAKNGEGLSKPFNLNISTVFLPFPIVACDSVLLARIGKPVNFIVNALRNPKTFYAVGLPKGLNIDSTTGLISGVLDSLVIPTIKLLAGNEYGLSDTFRLNLFVVKPPLIKTLPITGNTVYVDTFEINDTTLLRMVQFTLEAGTGNTKLTAVDSVMVPVIAGTKKYGIKTSIPAKYIDVHYGFRALLQVTTGSQHDSLYFSQSVLCDSASNEKFTIPSMSWTPLNITAVPLKNKAHEVLAEVFNGGKYDAKRLRLFRWTPGGTLKHILKDYIEYSDEYSGYFDFYPGNLIWIKAVDSVTVKIDNAFVPAINNSVSIPLYDSNWTDFSVPISFPVSLADIRFETSNDTPISIEEGAIQLYAWEKSATTFVPKPVFLSGVPGVNSSDVVLASGVEVPYSVFTPSNKHIRMIFQPVCTEIESQKQISLKKSIVRQDQSWSVCISCWNGSGGKISSMYCGGNSDLPQKKIFAVPPTFSALSTQFCNVTGDTTFGHVIENKSISSGMQFFYKVENQSESPQTVRISIDSVFNLPDSIRALIANFDSRSQSSEVVTELSKGQQRRFVVNVGTEAFLMNAFDFQPKAIPRTELHSAIYNKMNKSLVISYSIEFKGISEMQLELINLSGRIVFADQFDEKSSGNFKVSVPFISKTSGNIANGLYILRMRVKNEEKQMVFNRCITIL